MNSFEAEREPRRWPWAIGVSAAAHGLLLVLGQGGLEARPDADGRGVGPGGSLRVVALTPSAARELTARAGPLVPALLTEAGGGGRASSSTDAFSPALPPGPDGPDLGSLDLLEPPLAGLGGTGTSGDVPSLLEAGLPAPEALPAPSTGATGRPVDPSAGASTGSDPSAGPDRSGDDPAGGLGREREQGGASDGDASPGLDAGRSDRFVTRRELPDYPPALAARDAKAGIDSRSGTLGVRVAQDGGVAAARVLTSTGDAGLDTEALRALRRWKFDAAALSAAGLLGNELRVEIRVRR